MTEQLLDAAQIKIRALIINPESAGNFDIDDRDVIDQAVEETVDYCRDVLDAHNKRRRLTLLPPALAQAMLKAFAEVRQHLDEHTRSENAA